MATRGRPRKQVPAAFTQGVPAVTERRIRADFDKFLALVRSGVAARRALARVYPPDAPSEDPLASSVSEDDLYRFLRVVDGAREALDLARAEAAHAHADIVGEIAQGEFKDPNRAGVQMKAAQWVASRRDPGAYGERVNVNVTHIDMGDVLRQANERARLALARREHGALIEHSTGAVVADER